jgi:phage gp36-like protein
MAYATAQDFVDRYGAKESSQLSNRNSPTATTADEDRLNLALVAASGIIDSWLCGRYSVPIFVPEAVEPLRHHCLVLARCELDNISIREKCQADCDRTYEWLKQVAAGKITFGMPGLPAQPDLAGSTSGVRSVARGRKAEGIDLTGY